MFVVKFTLTRTASKAASICLGSELASTSACLAFLSNIVTVAMTLDPSFAPDIVPFEDEDDGLGEPVLLSLPELLLLRMSCLLPVEVLFLPDWPLFFRDRVSMKFNADLLIVRPSDFGRSVLLRVG